MGLRATFWGCTNMNLFRLREFVWWMGWYRAIYRSNYVSLSNTFCINIPLWLDEDLFKGFFSPVCPPKIQPRRILAG